MLVSLISMVQNVHSSPPSTFITLNPNVLLSVSNLNMTSLSTNYYDKITEFSTNNTIRFNVTGLEGLEPHFMAQFRVTNIHNIPAISLVFDTIGLIKVLCTCNIPANFNSPVKLTYGLVSGDILTLIWAGATAFSSESQRVIIIDDFLSTNPLLDSQWTLDAYNAPRNQAGMFTSSGYAVMKALPTSGTETFHSMSPSFNITSTYPQNNLIIKRKLTISLYPFLKKESPSTGDIRIGMTPLLSLGAYPGNNPANTPFMDPTNNCASPDSTSDNIGSEYLVITNSGQVSAVTCGDAGTSNRLSLETVDPTLYTVFTVETFGVYCTICVDNVLPTTSWVWFRVYQRTTTGSLIASTDTNHNFTSTPNIAPYFQNSFVFVSQTNSNGASTGQVSKIDLIQLQNYGSPVCLSVPGGQLCTNFPQVPSSFGQGVISDIAWLSNVIGFGDPQIGAIILFFVLSGAFAFIPLIFTRNYLVAGLGELTVIGFFTYAGFLPEFVIIIPIIGGAVLMVMLIRKMVSGHSFSGGSE